MCRKNLASAAGLIGFGAGILVGMFFESQLVALVVGAAAISGGIFLVRGKCRA